MTIGDNSVQPDFMQIGSLQLQHLIDAFSIDFICSFADLLRSAICTTKASIDEPLAVFVQQIKGVKMRAGRNLDQLCKTVSDLCCRKGSKEGEVEKGMHRCMISAQAIFIVTIVDGHFD